MAETIAGGYYEGPAGKFHDANGKEVAKRSDASVKAEAAEATEAAANPVAPTGAPLPKRGAKRAKATKKSSRGKP